MTSSASRILRLYPPPETLLGAGSVYENLHLCGSKRLDRPYVAINAVSSVNGGAALSGGGSSIASRIDRLTMRTLRSHFDAVLVGANTLRSERVSFLDSRDRRLLLVVLTTTGELPLEANPGDCVASNTIIFAPDSLPVAKRQELSHLASISILRPLRDGTLNVQRILQTLKSRYGVQRLLAEGGPSLNSRLVSGGLADELFLTLAPTLLPKHAPILSTPRRETLKLISTHLADSELYLRYTIARSTSQSQE